MKYTTIERDMTIDGIDYVVKFSSIRDDVREPDGALIPCVEDMVIYMVVTDEYDNDRLEEVVDPVYEFRAEVISRLTQDED